MKILYDLFKEKTLEEEMKKTRVKNNSSREKKNASQITNIRFEGCEW